MNYLMLVCGGDADPEPQSAAAGSAEAWVQEMDGRGVRVLGRALDPPATAATVRVRDGESLVSDGPFAESKEFVAGFDILSCADLDEALQVAARHPNARSGAAELRPFHDGLEITESARTWASSELPDSWALFFCVDGIPEADEVEAAVARDGDAWADRLRERGTFVLGHALGHADTATTVRVRGGETLLTDGPFVETKEFIAGLGVLCGVSRDEAIAAAAAHPLAAVHRVEVRRFADG